MCDSYTEYAAQRHPPFSAGRLQLPFQRPLEECRRFTSRVIESVIQFVTSKISNPDLAALFTNTFPNTLDTTIEWTRCVHNETETACKPLSYIVTGDIDAMWLRDSANQVIPYIPFAREDLTLKRLILGTIYMQSIFIKHDPHASAFRLEGKHHLHNSSAEPVPTVYQSKWEVDSLASFLDLSYQYGTTTGDLSFTTAPEWLTAVNALLDTVQKEQAPTFGENGQLLPATDTFQQETTSPTETQFLGGRGNPVQRTGMVKTLFRPSDDATLFPFFVPGNAMLSVQLDRLAQMIPGTTQAKRARLLAKEIHDGIYAHAIVMHPSMGPVFAYEVDGYGSSVIMDDANSPSLLSLSYLGFVPSNDAVYQNTRRLVLSRANPYFFSGPVGSGIGGPHVGLNMAWPMSQAMRILTSTDDNEILDALQILLNTTDGLGLIHESFLVTGDPNAKGTYTRSWFAWGNAIFSQALLKVFQERPYLLQRI